MKLVSKAREAESRDAARIGSRGMKLTPWENHRKRAALLSEVERTTVVCYVVLLKWLTQVIVSGLIVQPCDA